LFQTIPISQHVKQSSCLLVICYTFLSDTFLLALKILRDYQTQWKYYTRPGS